MSKNIVICCDGTGNEFGDRNSNVVELYSTLIVDGRRQIAYYHPGVGTMGAPTATNRLSKLWSVLTGLAFGAGLLDNVADAYRYLMEMFEEGDQVFLFGFSRGAYTVRVLGEIRTDSLYYANVRKIGIDENYGAWITSICSDISRFSGGTIFQHVTCRTAFVSAVSRSRTSMA